MIRKRSESDRKLLLSSPHSQPPPHPTNVLCLELCICVLWTMFAINHLHGRRNHHFLENSLPFPKMQKCAFLLKRDSLCLMLGRIFALYSNLHYFNICWLCVWCLWYLFQIILLSELIFDSKHVPNMSQTCPKASSRRPWRIILHVPNKHSMCFFCN